MSNSNDIGNKLRKACLANASEQAGGLNMEELRIVANALGYPATGNRLALRNILCSELYPDKTIPHPVQEKEVLDYLQQESISRKKRIESLPTLSKYTQNELYKQKQSKDGWTTIKKIKPVKSVKTPRGAEGKDVPSTRAVSEHEHSVNILYDMVNSKIVDDSHLITDAIADTKSGAFYPLFQYRFPYLGKDEGHDIARYLGPKGEIDPTEGGRPIAALVRGYGIKYVNNKSVRYDFPVNVVELLSNTYPEYTFVDMYVVKKKRKTYVDNNPVITVTPGYNQIAVITHEGKWKAWIEKDTKNKKKNDVNADMAKLYVYKSHKKEQKLASRRATAKTIKPVKPVKPDNTPVKAPMDTYEQFPSLDR